MRILLFISVVILSSCKNDNKLTFFNGKILILEQKRSSLFGLTFCETNKTIHTIHV